MNIFFIVTVIIATILLPKDREIKGLVIGRSHLYWNSSSALLEQGKLGGLLRHRCQLISHHHREMVPPHPLEEEDLKLPFLLINLIPQYWGGKEESHQQQLHWIVTLLPPNYHQQHLLPLILDLKPQSPPPVPEHATTPWSLLVLSPNYLSSHIWQHILVF